MTCHRFTVFLLLCFTASGCISLNEYAVTYRASAVVGPGLTDSTILLKEGRTTLNTTPLPSKQEQQERLLCEYFRNQLAIAAEKAQSHRLGVWLFPWYWPLHFLTFYIVPVEETQKANLVIKAAKNMEIAYQQSGEAFLDTCRYELAQKPLGEAFQSENPFSGDNWKNKAKQKM